VAHARRDAPNECVGLVSGRDGAGLRVHAAENVAASPYRFEVEGRALWRLLDAIEAGGEQVQAIYHSHTRSDAWPSQTDVTFSAGWPGVEWIIVGLRAAEPEVRSFLIADGEIRETPLEVL